MNGNNTGPINLGNPGEFTMLELAENVKELINPEVMVTMTENTPDDPRQRKPERHCCPSNGQRLELAFVFAQFEP
jgi:UDP-glucuronate decarboxylase